MNIGGLIGGLIAGLIGAILWGCIAYFGNLEIGWLAWGIGAAIGFGVSYGSSEGGVTPAVIAVVITFISLCGGKYIAVQMAVNAITNKANQADIKLTDEHCMMTMASQLVEEKTLRGEKPKFCNGKTFSNVERLADYPADVKKVVRDSWSEMTAEEKSEAKESILAEFEFAVEQFKGEIAKEAFFNSFGILDLVFFGLGIYTAGQIAFADYVRD